MAELLHRGQQWLDANMPINDTRIHFLVRNSVHDLERSAESARRQMQLLQRDLERMISDGQFGAPMGSEWARRQGNDIQRELEGMNCIANGLEDLLSLAADLTA
jgi:hypothetical protein